MIRAYQFRRDESDILEVRRLGASIEGKPLTYEEPASLRKSLPGDDTWLAESDGKVPGFEYAGQ